MVWQFQEGLMHFARGGKIGFTDTRGQEVIEPIYQSVAYYSSGFYHGYVAAQKDDKWGVIDTSGQEIVPIEYDKAYTFHDGYCIALKDHEITIFKEPEQTP